MLPLRAVYSELSRLMSQAYEQFMAGDISVPGSDVCDMSGAEGRTRDQFTVYNVMLPRTYCSDWRGSIFEQRCQVHESSIEDVPGDVHMFDSLR